MQSRISPVIAIVGNVQVARALSQRFLAHRDYFAMMEEPRLARDDSGAEILRRTNLLGTIPHEYLILAGCSRETRELLQRGFSLEYRQRVIEVEDECTMDDVLKPASNYCVKQEPDASPIDECGLGSLLASERIGVIEKSDCVGEVIAENYCVANGYKILKIQPATQELVDECEDLLREWNCSEISLRRSQAKERLFTLLRDRVGGLERRAFELVVFFTRGIPYGVLPFKSPVVHLFLWPDLGLQILRGYCRASEPDSGIAVALLCDPGDTPESETRDVWHALEEKGIEILDLTGSRATVYRFMQLIERYPYDFALISSHAGEVDGKRVTVEFTSSKGVKYTVVYDLYASFARVSESDEVVVQETTVPVTVNGVPWFQRKSEGDEELKDFDLREFCESKATNTLLRTEARKGMKFSNAIQLHNKLSWIPALHATGEMRYPIILNNACSSCAQMAGRFVFAGASVYIGTTKDIAASIASTCGLQFVRLATERDSIVHALFEAQKRFAEELGYSPYLYWGYPHSSLRPTCLNNKRIRELRLRKSLDMWQKKLSACNDGDMARKIRALMDCLEEAG